MPIKFWHMHTTGIISVTKNGIKITSHDTAQRKIQICYDSINKEISISILYKLLFKEEIKHDFNTTYLIGETLYHNEFDVILSHLHEIWNIKIYSDNTVRLDFLASIFYENRRRVVILTNAKTLATILKKI